MRTGQNIYRRKDGRWEARIALGKGTNGRPHFKYVYAGTYREVLNRKKDFEKEQQISQPAAPLPDDSFSGAAYHWLAASEKEWKPSTYSKYKNYLEKYILPEWQELCVHTIRQEQYNLLIEKLGQKLSASSLQTVNTIIKGSLKQVFRLLPISCHLPASDVKKTGLDTLSDAEVFRLLSHLQAQDSLMMAGIQLALFSGIRLGELCALTWADIDLESKVFHVRRTLQRIQNQNHREGEPRTCLHLGPPKNKRERTIPLHPQLMPLLGYWQERHLPTDYLLSGASAPVEPRRMTRQFKRILKECGIRDFRFHALRHTFASRCVESGMQIKALSEILGHSSVKITMDRYVHLSMNFKQSQIMVLQFSDSELLNRQKNGQIYEIS